MSQCRHVTSVSSEYLTNSTQRGLIVYERDNKRTGKEIIAGGAYQIMLTVLGRVT
jgi:hypothetical protein